MNLNDKCIDFFKNTRKILEKHSPEILTGTGIVCMISSTILAIKATPKAMKLIEFEKKLKKDEELDMTKTDIIKIVYKEYLPSLFLSLTGTAFIIGAGAINRKRNAALTTAYAISESTLLKYRNKVIETFGENKDKKIRKEISQDELNKNKKDDKQVYITSKGNTLFMDSISGRYFRSDIDKIKKIVNELNRQMLSQYYISLDDFYYELGLKSIKNGSNMGWNVDTGLIDITYNTCLADNDEPCIVLDYNIYPRYEYDKLM